MHTYIHTNTHDTVYMCVLAHVPVFSKAVSQMLKNYRSGFLKHRYCIHVTLIENESFSLVDCPALKMRGKHLCHVQQACDRNDHAVL